MIIKFQPEKTSLIFELVVYVYFGATQFSFGLLGMYGIEAFHAKVLIFWSLWAIALPVGGIALYGLVPRHVIARCTIIVFLGMGAALVKYFYVSTGIIDPVYIFLMTTTCVLVIAIYRGQFLFDQLEKVKDIDKFSESLSKYLESVVTSFRYFLTRVFQGFLALGASLGVSMSILFQEGFGSPELKFSALKMLLGFIFISVAMGLWIAIPMLNGMVQTQEKLLELTKNNDSTHSGDH